MFITDLSKVKAMARVKKTGKVYKINAIYFVAGSVEIATPGKPYFYEKFEDVEIMLEHDAEVSA